MRTNVVVLALCAGTLAACSEQPTAPAVAPSPSLDAMTSASATAMTPVASVTGGGTVVYPESLFPTNPGYSETYGLSVRSRPDGSVQGMVQTRWEAPYDVRMHSEVTCLKVTGNTAAMTMRVTRSNNPDYAVGSLWTFRVRDGAATDETDAISYFFPRSSESDCQTFNFEATTTGRRLFEWTSGNVTID